MDSSDTQSVASRSESRQKAVVGRAQKIALQWIYWACKCTEPKRARVCVCSPTHRPAVGARADVCCYLCRKNYPLLLPTLAKAGMLTTAEAGIVASVFEAVVGAVTQTQPSCCRSVCS